VPTVLSIVVPALGLWSFVRRGSCELVILFPVDPHPNFFSTELLEVGLVQSLRGRSRLRPQFMELWIGRIGDAPMWKRSYLLLLLTLGESRVVGAGTETATGALLRRPSFLLTWGALLTIILIVVLIRRSLLI
jgi:hypothetical protein